MSEVMVDFNTYASGAVAASHRSGASSTYRSTADRSGTEIVESDHFVINKEAYFQSSESYHHQQ